VLRAKLSPCSALALTSFPLLPFRLGKPCGLSYYKLDLGINTGVRCNNVSNLNLRFFFVFVGLSCFLLADPSRGPLRVLKALYACPKSRQAVHSYTCLAIQAGRMNSAVWPYSSVGKPLNRAAVRR